MQLLTHINFFAFSSILIVVTTVSMAIFILGKARYNKINQIWASFCILVSIWGISGYGFSTVSAKDDALYWWKVANIGAIFIPVVYYHFLYVFLDFKKTYLKHILYLSYFLGFVFLGINFIFPENFVGDVRLVFNHIYVPDSFNLKNPAYLLFYVGFYWVLLLFSFSMLIAYFMDSKGVVRNQLKYFIVGSVIGWLGPHGFFLLVFNINVYPFSNFLIACSFSV